MSARPTRIQCALFLALQLLPAGCGKLLDSKDVSRRSSAMLLLDGARDVQYSSDHGPLGQPAGEHIWYVVDVPFPGESIVCQLTRHLAKNGWQPLSRISDDTGTPSSFLQGWRVIIYRRGRPDEHHIDLWDAEWANSEGDLLSYSLTYRYPSGGAPDQGRMGVGGVLQPAGILSASDRARTRDGKVAAGKVAHLTPDQPASCGERN